MRDIALPGLKTAYLGRPFLYFDELPSTNTFLKENAASLPHGAACAAASQTAGKGRMGRDWHNIKNQGLMFSFLLHSFNPSEMGALPLVVGLGVSMAVEKMAGIEAGLKWSNDVLFEEKKLCGILCESTIRGSAAQGIHGMGGDGGFAVVGMGLNLLYGREALDSLGLLYATSLFLATKKEYGEPEAAAYILNELEPLLEIYRASGFSALRGAYEERCRTVGRLVSVISGGDKREAVACGIGDDGSLICSSDGKLFSVNSGEASVIPMTT